MLNFTDKPHVTIVDGNTHHQTLTKNIEISNKDIDFYIVNPSAFTMMVEILKDGISIYSDNMLNRTMKNYKDSVLTSAKYVVNFYKESSTVDSEVVIAGINDNNYEKTPTERCSFNLTVGS
tara:strand:+ start:60 stop:422 length:363 start_codon:yes stop_codon:yes gene_type:complete